MILKIQTNWKSSWYSSFLWKFNIKVKNPPFLSNPPFSPTPPFLQKIFHPHPYCPIWGIQSPPFVKGRGGVRTMNMQQIYRRTPYQSAISTKLQRYYFCIVYRWCLCPHLWVNPSFFSHPHFYRMISHCGHWRIPALRSFYQTKIWLFTL